MENEGRSVVEVLQPDEGESVSSMKISTESEVDFDKKNDQIEKQEVKRTGASIMVGK